jgi:hypothetical protein
MMIRVPQCSQRLRTVKPLTVCSGLFIAFLRQSPEPDLSTPNG